jgi:hypothetical protein
MKSKHKRLIVVASVLLMAGASAVPVLAGARQGNDAGWQQMSESACRAAAEESGMKCGWTETVTP